MQGYHACFDIKGNELINDTHTRRECRDRESLMQRVHNFDKF